MKRHLSFLLPLILFAGTSLVSTGANTSEDWMKLHQQAIVFDAHCDTAMRLVGPGAVDLGQRLPDGHMDLPRIKEGGLDAQIFAVWLPPSMPDNAMTERAHAMIDAIWDQSRKHSDKLAVALKGSEIRPIVESGRVAAIIGLEGGHIIGESLDALRDYYKRGVRCMTLTWMNTNKFADSSDDSTKWGGLNDFGRSVVREMDKLGMVIDCAHVSEKTFYGVLATTKSPVLISHSCMRALCDIPRNVTDDELRALKKHGGVICVNYFAGFLDADYNKQVTGLWAEFRKRANDLAPNFGGDAEKAWESLQPEFHERAAKIPPVPFSRLIDHIDHAVKVAGIDHVGLGSDFDGISTTPVGLDDVSKLPLITQELVKRGYSDEDVKKILGGNLLKLIESTVK